MPGKRSAEALKRRSEKGARHVYAALQRCETTVAIREVAARRREEMAPQINAASLVVAQAAVGRWRRCSRRCACRRTSWIQTILAAATRLERRHEKVRP